MNYLADIKLKKELEAKKSKIKSIEKYMKAPYESVHRYGSKSLQGDKYECNGCEHEWKTKNHAGKSSRCPSCRTSNITNTSVLAREKAKKDMLKHLSDLKKELKVFEKNNSKAIEKASKPKNIMEMKFGILSWILFFYLLVFIVQILFGQ
jgi:predicted Zn-ribbon and HTH transcriptional regulator